MICGLFGLAMVILTYVVNLIVNKSEGYTRPELSKSQESEGQQFPEDLLVAAMTVAALYLVVFINWGIWKTDFQALDFGNQGSTS